MIRLIKFIITGDWRLNEWEEVRRFENKYQNGVVHRVEIKCKNTGILKVVSLDFTK